jgi:ribonuclease P protein component
LSLGVLPTGTDDCRIGLRTRRGLKGAVVRNRLKRQLRGLLAPPKGLILKSGVDVVIVAHPAVPAVRAETLRQELVVLCRKAKVLV